MGQRGSSGFASEQSAVAARIAAGLAVTAVIWAVAWALPLQEPTDRTWWLLVSTIAPTIGLAVGIAFVARHRFLHPEAIDGDDPAQDETLRRAQAYLRNTTEQTLLAALVYPLMAFALPTALLPALPLSALAFLAGRLGFARGLGRSARYRALGFALTFYPALAGLLASALCLIAQGV